MRIQQLVLAMALGFFGAHCSSEEPLAPQAAEAVVENVPGNLVITSPARAAFIEGGGGDIAVEGTGATKELTINGAPAEVDLNGKFHAKVTATAGLNLIVAVDGESRLETPFLYGHFVSATTPVDQAVAMEIGAQGIGAAAPATSLESVTNKLLASKDLLASVKGKTFSGSMSGANWTFKVTGGKYKSVAVGLTPKTKGLALTAAVKDLAVDGTLTLKFAFLSHDSDVHVTATGVNAKGDVSLSLEPTKGALKAAMPTPPETQLEGFKYDSDNAGLPCCVDSIITKIMRPKIEEAIRDGINDNVPDALEVTLDGIGLPKALDLSKAGITKPIPITTKFDGVDFDTNGGTFTASVLFGGPVEATSPAAKAPGWLKLGQPINNLTRAESLGVSFSLDAVNQLFFAAWATGSLTRAVPDVGPVTGLTLNAGLPPILSVSDSAIRVALGEVMVKANLGGNPFTAAITIMQDVTPSTNEQFVVLTPKGEPTIAITWLAADDVARGVRNIIAIAVKEQLTKFLKPMQIPFPSVALTKLGPAFAGESLGVSKPMLAVDGKSARLSVSGAMALVKTPAAPAPAAAPAK